MIIDGKALASQIKSEIKKKVELLARPPHLLIVLVGDNPMSVKYTGLKQRLGEELGIVVTVKRLSQESATANVVEAVHAGSDDSNIDGIIVQLPLPDHIDREAVIAAIAPSKDVDALTKNPLVLSPVIGALKIILETSNLLNVSGLDVLVIGRGRLVGEPAAAWLESMGANVSIADSSMQVQELNGLLEKADIIVTGAGVPGLVTPEKIKEGVILLDASTSDVHGKTVGDIDPACATKAKLYTPVPGGVGPLTVVMLFSNLIELVKKN